MITLSIDIGLRNLSMCIMNCNHEILLWNVYNVFDSDEHYCRFQSNDSICNKKCSLKYKLDDSEISFTCKKHFPENLEITKDNIYKKKNIDSYSLHEISLEFLKCIQQIYDQNNELFKDINLIVLELQPRMNNKAIFTSHILFGKLVDLYRDTNVIIKFVRASEKLKAYTGPEIVCSLKNIYAQRKWLSIQYCIWILENIFSDEQKNKWLCFFNSCSKKDDLSDAFLMAINCIKKSK